MGKLVKQTLSSLAILVATTVPALASAVTNPVNNIDTAACKASGFTDTLAAWRQTLERYIDLAGLASPTPRSAVTYTQRELYSNPQLSKRILFAWLAEDEKTMRAAQEVIAGSGARETLALAQEAAETVSVIDRAARLAAQQYTGTDASDAAGDIQAETEDVDLLIQRLDNLPYCMR